MPFPAAPQTSASEKIHFLTKSDDTAKGWVSVVNGATSGTNAVGWAGVATHYEGNAVASPAGISTTSVPLVLVGGDDGTNAVPLQVNASGFLKAILQANAGVTVGAVEIAASQSIGNDELPAAAALADAAANPTTTTVGAGNLMWNGTTWDRVKGDTTSGLWVNVKAMPSSVTVVQSTFGTLKADANLYVNSNLVANGNPVPISDAAGSLTVDGTVTVSTISTSITPGTGAANLGKAVDSAAGGTDTGVVTLAIRDDALTTLTPIDGDYTPLRVDSTGALHVTGGGGGTQYVVDGVASLTPTGTVAVVKRVDSAGTLVGGDGDYTWLQVDAAGALRVTGGGGGTQYNVDAASSGAKTGTATLAIRDDTLGTLTEVNDDWTTLRTNDRGALWVEHDGTIDVSFSSGSAVSTSNGLPIQFANSAGLSDSTANPATVMLGAATMLWDPGGSVWKRVSSTNPLPISDASGSLTVDGTVAVSGTTSLTPGTAAANLGKAIDSAAGATDTGVAILAVRDDALSALTPVEGDYVPFRVDSTGALYVTGGGGGTQYVVDGIASATPTGSVAVVKRQDAAASLVGADGDYTWLQVDSSGALRVTGGGGGTQYNVDAASAGTKTGTASLAIRDDSLGTLTEIDDDWTNLRTSSRGALWVVLDSAVALPAGTNNIGDVDVLTLPALPAGTNNIGDVDVVSLPALPAGTNNIGDVDVLSLPALPAGTNNIGDVDVLTLPALPAGTNNIGDVDVLTEPATAAVAGSVPAVVKVIAGTDGTNIRTIKTDTSGELQVDVLTLPALAAGTNNIGDVDVLSLPALAAGTNNIGDVDILTLPFAAHDAAMTGTPVPVGLRANTNEPTAVTTDADSVYAWGDRYGRTVTVEGHPNPATPVTGTATSSTVDLTLVAAPGAGQCIYVTGIQATNGETALRRLSMRDGTTNRKVMYLAASGGGFVANYRPWWQLTANTALNALLDATVATGVTINVDYFVAPAP